MPTSYFGYPPSHPLTINYLVLCRSYTQYILSGPPPSSQLGEVLFSLNTCVEIFPPPGHTGVWCSGNTPSLALCNEESCGSIPSMTDSFYENANMADTRRNLPFTISVRDIHFIMLLIPSLTKLGFCLSFFGFCLL